MFATVDALDLDLFAPALDEDAHDAHFITMRNTRFHGRWVRFVEIMVPGFSRRALERLLPTFDLTETGRGWGLDSVCPRVLGYGRVAIIDGTPVSHTRPVGRMRDADLAEWSASPTQRSIDRDPRVREWITCYQRGRPPRPPYRTEGTPTLARELEPAQP
jgi:hypothetical protein